MNKKFEDEQERLDILSITINCKQNYFYSLYEFLSNFVCSKCNGKANILRLYPNQRTIKVTNLFGNARDSLFYHRNGKSYIYITPHFLYLHPPDGRCATEFICQQESFCIKIAKIATIPRQTIRSHDGHCIEYHDDIDDVGEGFRRNLRLCDIDLYLKFIDNLIITFIETKYLPYIIHPNRLVITNSRTDEEGTLSHLKIVSLNLLSYIFSPQNSNFKILNATFSHPLSFIKNDAVESKITKKLNDEACSNILDFLHSAFVTTLWIFTSGEDCQFLTQVKRNMTMKVGNANFKPSRDQLKKIPTDWKRCDNPFGFCHNFPKKKLLVHNYGCLHLMRVLPEMLEDAMNDSFQSGSFVDIEHFMLNCVMTFKIFIREMRKEDDSEEEEGREDEKKNVYSKIAKKPAA